MRTKSVLVCAAVWAVLTPGCGGDDEPACSNELRPGGGSADVRSQLPLLPPGVTWQWQIDGDLETDLDVTVYDVDLFDTAASDIAALRDAGRIVICYFSAGSWEEWRDDADAFDEAVIGEPLEDWPGERYLDHRDAGVRQLMQARLDLAVSRGCDGVEPDNVDTWDSRTGFDITRADQLAYNRFLAAEAHLRGLSVGLKNAPDLVDDLVDAFDWSLVEECVRYDECDAYRPFIEAGKAVLNAEYIDDECDTSSAIARFCDDPQREGFSTLVKQWDLLAWGVSCDAR